MRSALAVTAAVLLPAVCIAQPAPQRMSLERALEIAELRSEQMAIARAGVSRAEAEHIRARSERYPQLNLSASYDRTLASEFEGLFEVPQDGSDGGDPGGVDFEQLPFGRKNIWRVNLQVSQSLFTGGRVAAQERIASSGEANAGITLASARAQLALDVVRAYYDAVLSDRLVSIAEAAYAQADAAYRQTRLQREAGTQPEFELLRAQVARDNQRPPIIRRRAGRQIAQLRLKQLLELPAAEPLLLTDNLEDEALPPPPRFATAVAAAERQVIEVRRTSVTQAENLVRASEAAVSIARAQRLPSVSLTSSYGRVNYPSNVFPDWTDFRTNWTVGAVMQVPLLTGGRLRAGEMVARADVEEARARLQQTRELAELDTEAALEELVAARAAWEASAGTVQQAGRAYEIAELRYRQGISTQLELSDSRFLLAQSQANRAQAARDLQVARARVALLPDLPIGASQVTPPSESVMPQEMQQPQQQVPAASPAMRTALAGGSIQP